MPTFNASGVLANHTGVTAWKLSDYNFSISYNPVQTLVSGNATINFQYKDSVYTSITSATVDNNQQFTLTSVTGLQFENINYTSLDPNIAIADSDGTILRANVDGTARILVNTPKLTKRQDVAVSRTTGQNTVSFTGFAADSLAYNIGTGIDVHISGVTASTTTQSMFLNPSDTTFTRNPSCWTYGWDTSCVPCHNDFVNRWGGVLVSPRHIIMADHATLPTGTNIYYVDTNGNTVHRSLTAIAHAISGSDIAVGLLNSDVPNVTFAKVLPTGWSNYLPTLITSVSQPSGQGFPALALNQQYQALIKEVYFCNSRQMNTRDNRTTSRVPFDTAIIKGDSGSPAFFVINGQLTLIYTWFGTTQGPHVADYTTAINNAMTGLGGGYTLTQVDLTGFTSY